MPRGGATTQGSAGGGRREAAGLGTAYCGFCGKKQGRRGEQAENWLVCITSGPRSPGAVPSGLVRGLGATRTGAAWPGV